MRRETVRNVVKPMAALLLGALLLTGCGQKEAAPISAATSNFEVADDGGKSPDLSPATPKSPAGAPVAKAGEPTEQGGPIPREPLDPSPSPRAVQPPVKAGKELSGVGEYKVPEGASVIELLGFADRMGKMEPKGSTQQEQLVDFQNMQRARITAAEKVLAAEEADTDQKVKAVGQKLAALRMLADLGVREVVDHTRQFTAALREFDDPKIATIGRLLYFGLRGGDLRDETKADPAWVLEEMAAILKDEELTADVFNVTSEAARMLQQMDFLEEGQKAKVLITTAFKDVEDKNLREGVNQFSEEMDIAGVGVEEKLEAALAGEANAVPALLDTMKQILQAPTRGRPTLAVALQCAQYMEYSRNYEASKQIYDAIEASYKDFDDEKLQEHKDAAIANGRKRVNLIGKPFEVMGKNLDGSPFDWNKYNGKIVLVDFWASWCGPCLAEMPNIKKNYDKYREKGFEVVGVNLDDNDQMIEQFFKVQKLPWPTVFSNDPEARGFKHPLAVSCGIDAIPFIVLVGADGKVIDLHLRGQDLGKALAGLLDAPAKAPAEPKAPPAAPAGKTGALSPKASQPMDEVVDSYFVSFVADEDEAGAEESEAEEQNPYSPKPGLTPAELVKFIFKMEDKPQSIQKREGFAEALIEAADLILAADDANDKQEVIAATTKFRILHKASSFEDQEADEALLAFMKQMKDDQRPKIAREVKFLMLERRAMNAKEIEREERQQLLTELKEYFTDRELTERHLRLASNTVRILNTVADIEQREKQFGEFGKLFGESKNRQLAKYGRKLAKSPTAAKQSDLVGKPLELSGLTALGVDFDWKAYRGKVVLVDFWATWCGPCRKEMPNLQAFYQEHKPRGLDVVAVNLDRDEEALAKYLDEKGIAWENLVGDNAKMIAKKYGVSGIPTVMLLNRQGEVVAVSHKLNDVKDKALELLSKKE